MTGSAPTTSLPAVLEAAGSAYPAQAQWQTADGAVRAIVSKIHHGFWVRLFGGDGEPDGNYHRDDLQSLVALLALAHVPVESGWQPYSPAPARH